MSFKFNVCCCCKKSPSQKKNSSNNDENEKNKSAFHVNEIQPEAQSSLNTEQIDTFKDRNINENSQPPIVSATPNQTVPNDPINKNESPDTEHSVPVINKETPKTPTNQQEKVTTPTKTNQSQEKVTTWQPDLAMFNKEKFEKIREKFKSDDKEVNTKKPFGSVNVMKHYSSKCKLFSKCSKKTKSTDSVNDKKAGKVCRIVSLFLIKLNLKF
jgi:hypothetical protein